MFYWDRDSLIFGLWGKQQFSRENRDVTVYLAWWDICLQGSSEAVFLKPGMGFKGSAYVCMFVYTRACIHSKTCLPSRRSQGPTCPSGYTYRHKIQVTSAPSSGTHWLHL